LQTAPRSRIKPVRARLCTDHDAAITGARGSLHELCTQCHQRTGNGEETMMRISGDAAECLLTHAHALRLQVL
jgi:cytochrome c553